MSILIMQYIKNVSYEPGCIYFSTESNLVVVVLSVGVDALFGSASAEWNDNSLSDLTFHTLNR